jgi:hypothetical protein
MTRTILLAFFFGLGVASWVAAQTPPTTVPPQAGATVGANFVDADGDGICDLKGTRSGERRGKGYGPGNGTGNGRVGPQDGSGYGPGTGPGSAICNGTGQGKQARQGQGRGRR